MTQPFPLEILKELSTLRNDQAARALGYTNRRFQQERDKLVMLQNFRSDYETRYEQAGQKGESYDTLINFRNFLDRLDEAVRQQAAVLEQMQEQLRHNQAEVRKTYHQVQSMEVLADRHADREQLKENRREQKTTDEMVNQNVQRRVMETD